MFSSKNGHESAAEENIYKNRSFVIVTKRTYLYIIYNVGKLNKRKFHLCG